jgi:hypothetical protein
LEPIPAKHRAAEKRGHDGMRSDECAGALANTAHERFLVGKRMSSGLVRDFLKRRQPAPL